MVRYRPASEDAGAHQLHHHPLPNQQQQQPASEDAGAHQLHHHPLPNQQQQQLVAHHQHAQHLPQHLQQHQHQHQHFGVLRTADFEATAAEAVRARPPTAALLISPAGVGSCITHPAQLPFVIVSPPSADGAAQLSPPSLAGFAAAAPAPPHWAAADASAAPAAAAAVAGAALVYGAAPGKQAHQQQQLAGDSADEDEATASEDDGAAAGDADDSQDIEAAAAAAPPAPPEHPGWVRLRSSAAGVSVAWHPTAHSLSLPRAVHVAALAALPPLDLPLQAAGALSAQGCWAVPAGGSSSLQLGRVLTLQPALWAGHAVLQCVVDGSSARAVGCLLQQQVLDAMELTGHLDAALEQQQQQQQQQDPASPHVWSPVHACQQPGVDWGQWRAVVRSVGYALPEDRQQLQSVGVRLVHVSQLSGLAARHTACVPLPHSLDADADARDTLALVT